jgi:hypothetical protein
VFMKVGQGNVALGRFGIPILNHRKPGKRPVVIAQAVERGQS